MDRSFFDDKLDRLDDLTNVYLRDVMDSYMAKLLKEGIPFDLAILDVDNFKHVNDNNGHLVGDKALVKIAGRIQEIVGDDGVVGRYGGDEFLIILENFTEYEKIWDVLHKLLSASKNLDDELLDSLAMTVTIGSSRYPKDGTNLSDLYEFADKALYRGKMKGRNCFIIYLPEKHAGISLKTEKDKSLSSMYLHAKLFNSLTSTSDFASNIQDCINYIGGYFMIDHLCIETDKSLSFNYYHPICKNRNFKPIGVETLDKVVNQNSGFFYLNEFDDNFNAKIGNAFLKQGVYSVCMCELQVFGKHFGYVRADICENPRGRVWQNLDLDVLLNFTHALALILYYQDLKIDDFK